MSQTLPPTRTAGTVADVGASIAAAFGRRDRPAAPAAAPAPRAPEPVNEGDWDPEEVLGRHAGTQAATRAPRALTLDEVWAAQAVEEGAADWTPTPPPARSGPALSAASLAAHALSRMTHRG